MECAEESACAGIIDAVRRAVIGVSGRVVVGYSGGLDSTVLLWAAAQCVQLERLLAAHVNHNAQPAASSWEAHCRQEAAALGVPFISHAVEIAGSGNFEAAARGARYAWFGDLLETGDVLLLAHHRRDQVETALLRLLQGRGAYGMPENRQLAAGRILRPLLTSSQEEIEACARSLSLRFVEDPTNLTGEFDRSWIRQSLLPLLRSRWPLVEAHIVQVSDVEGGVEAAGRWLAGGLPHPLPVARLPEDPAARVELVRWWLEAQGMRATPRAALEPWLSAWLLADRTRATTLTLRAGKLIGYRAALYVQAVPPPLPVQVSVASGESLDLGHGVLLVKGGEPLDRWVVRFRTGGETLRVRSQVRRISALLQSSVLPWERDRYPLLYRNGELVAVPGIASGEAASGLEILWQPRVPVFLPGLG